MRRGAPCFTYIGGPTLLLEMGGVRLLTDPTLDPAGTDYPTGAYTLRKTAGPAIARSDLGPIDVVLLSHDHHSDNLDREGRALLADAGLVLTTSSGAGRVEGRARGLAAGDSYTVETPNAGALRITATPARHGPDGGDRGPVIGFLLESDEGLFEGAIWITGDTVWYPELSAMRADVRCAVCFFGAARVAVAGPSPLTLTADDGIALARHFADARIVPVHYEDWEHFTEGRRDIDAAFAAAGLSSRLMWLERAVRTPMQP